MSAYATAVLASSPRAYYRLGEVSGTTAFDLSGNAYHGTLTGGITPMQQNAIITDYTDYAMLFDGVSGRIKLPAGLVTDGLAALSVECWFYLPTNTFTHYQYLIANESPLNSLVGFSLQIVPSNQGDGIGDNQSAYFVVGNGTTGVVKGIGTGIFSAQTWYHIVSVFNGSTLAAYVNGVPDQKTNPALSGTVGTATHQVIIGSSPSPSNFFSNVIDEVAIYPSALSAATVLSNYNIGAFGRTGITYFPTAVRRQT